LQKSVKEKQQRFSSHWNVAVDVSLAGHIIVAYLCVSMRVFYIQYISVCLSMYFYSELCTLFTHIIFCGSDASASYSLSACTQ